MPTPIPPYKYPKLINIINGTYSDGIDEIVSARTEDDKTILCICRDGEKQLAAKITTDEIAIKLLNPNPDDKSANFAAAGDLDRLSKWNFWWD